MGNHLYKNGVIRGWWIYRWHWRCKFNG